MTSIRAIWLLDANGTVLLSRRYSTVERRVKRRHGICCTTDTDTPYPYHKYESIAIPNDTTFSTLFKTDFLDRFRHGSSPNYPVISLGGQNNFAQELWPVIAVSRHDAFLVAVPEVDGFLVAKSPSDRPPAAQLPSVTATFALLDGLAPFVARARENIFSTASLAKLQCHLCSIMPFGTPIETNLKIIDASMKPTNTRGAYPQKRPAWKPEVLSNMRQSLDIAVKETVSVMIYGRQQEDRRSSGRGRGNEERRRESTERRRRRQGGGEGRKQEAEGGSANSTTGANNDQEDREWGEREVEKEREGEEEEEEEEDSDTTLPDVCHVRGTIECNSKLNGVPEVSLVVSTNHNRRRSSSTNTQEEDTFPAVILVHECVLPPSTIASRQIIFSPPIGRFDLARYSYQNDAKGYGSGSGNKGQTGQSGQSGGGGGGGSTNIPVRALYQVELRRPGEGEDRDGANGHGGGGGGDSSSPRRLGKRKGQQYDIRLHLRWGMDISVQQNAIVKEFTVVLPFGGHLVSHTLTTTTGTLNTIDQVVEDNHGGGDDGHVSTSHGGGGGGGSENIRTKLLWTPGSKFKHEGTDAILTGTITMAPMTTPRPKLPEVLVAAPDLVSGMCTGDRSPMPLSNQLEQMAVHQQARQVEQVMRDQTKGRPEETAAVADAAPSANNDGKHVKGEGNGNDAQDNGHHHPNHHCVEPNLQKKNLREDWKTWSEFSKGGLDACEMGGVDVMDRASCYAEINFKIAGYSLSGTHVNRHGVSVQPSTSATINTTVELSSGKYIVWNRFGDSRHVSLPKKRRGGGDRWV